MDADKRRLYKKLFPFFASLRLCVSLIYIFLCFLWLFFNSAQAAEVVNERGDPKQGKSLQFRRVFVPADRIDDWPRGDTRYLPIDVAEFERLTHLAAASPSASIANVASHIDDATYEAKLVDGQLVDGRATLSIRHLGTKPTVLPLNMCRLALSESYWEDKNRTPATLALTAAAGSGVIVDRTAKLTFRWSLRAERSAPGDIEFHLDLPPSPTKRLLLHLPLGAVPITDVGLVVPPKNAESKKEGGSQRTWLVELGGRSAVVLRIATASGTSASASRRTMPSTRLRQHSTLLRQHLEYDISPRGLDLQARLSYSLLATHEQQRLPRRLQIEVDRPLTLVEVRSGATLLPWRPIHRATGTSRPTDDVKPKAAAPRAVTLEIELPESVQDRLELQLIAMAPLEVGQNWSLPTVRPKNVLWIEGDARIRISEPLALEQLQISSGRRLNANPHRSEGNPPHDKKNTETAWFQYFGSDATANVRVANIDHVDPGRHDAHVTCRTGTTLELAEREVAGRVRAEFRTTGPRVFSLEARVADGWTVTAVESDPSGLAADWQIRDTPDGIRLLVRLARPLSPSQSILLDIALNARQGHLTDADLSLVDFGCRSGGVPRVLARVAPFLDRSDFQLDIVGGEDLARLSVAQLSAKDRTFFDSPDRGVLFAAPKAAQHLQIQLSPERPPNTAQAIQRPTAAIVPALQKPGQTPEKAQSPSCVWHSEIDARSATDGTTDYLASFWIENGGRERVDIRLPGGAIASGLWVNGQKTPPTSSPANRSVLDIPLPSGHRFVSVVVRYRVREKPFTVVSRVTVQPPVPQLPVFGQRVTLWLPPSYLAYGRRTIAQSDPITLSERLLGPLGRARHARPFNPFDPQQWLVATPSHNPSRGFAEHRRELSGSPWPRTTHQNRPDISGWSATTLQLPILQQAAFQFSAGQTTTNGTIRLNVVRRSSSVLLASLAFCLTLGLMTLRFCRRPAATIGILTIACLAALTAPDAYVSITSGILLGILASFAATGMIRTGLIRHRLWPMARRDATETPLPPVGIPAAPLLLIAAIGLTNVTPALAQEAPSQEIAFQKTATVLIPIDEKAISASAARLPLQPSDARLQPVGGKVYVPEHLFQALHRRAAQSSRQAGAWALSHARYRGQMTAGDRPDQLTVESFRAVFELQVFGRAVRVRIPVSRRGASWPEGAVRLDGRPIAWQWSQDGRSLQVVVDEPGSYQLSIEMKPTVRTDRAVSEFSLAVPPLHDARLDLSLPADAPPIEIPTARGIVENNPDRTRLTAQLGAIDRLIVRWAAARDSDYARPNIELNELLWLHVRPDVVMLDAKFQLKVLDGKLGSKIDVLHLAVDARLKLLPLGKDSPIERVRIVERSPEGSGKNVLALYFRNRVMNETTLTLRFLVTAPSGTSGITLPDIEVLHAESRSRQLAVTIHEALTYAPPTTEDSTALDPAVFVDAWADNSPARPLPPQLAYEISESTHAWSLIAEPRHKTTHIADQQITLNASRRSADVLFDVQLETSPPQVFQYRIQCPPTMTIDDVSVRNAGTEMVKHWSRDPSGTLTVMLKGPVGGVSRLVLRGTIAVGEDDQFAIPPIELLDSEIRNRQVALYRKPDVLLELSEPGTLQPIETAKLRAGLPGPARPIGIYAFDTPLPDTPSSSAPSSGAPSSGAKVHVRPNEPKFVVTQWTSLHASGGAWAATVDLHLSVEQGIVDTLRLAIPSWWNGPFEVRFKGESSVVESIAPLQSISRNGRDRYLKIRLPNPVVSSDRLRIRGPLVRDPENTLRVPDARPVDADRVDRFISLPDRAELEAIRWETTGLESATLPAEFAHSESAQQSFSTYRVAGSTFEARLARVRPTTSVPKVRLADIQVLTDRTAAIVTVAAFDLEVAGTSDCTLRMPKGAQLLRATVAGLPANLQPSGESLWKLSFGSPELPQRVEILYTMVRATHPEATFRAPELLADGHKLHVEQTLWTLCSDATDVHATSPAAQTPIPSVRQELLRLDTIASLLDIAPEVASRQSKADLSSWYRRWAQRLVWSRQRIAEQAGMTGHSNSASEQAKAIIANQRDVARGLGTESELAEILTTVPSAEESIQLASLSLDRRKKATQFVFSGPAQTLSVRFRYPDEGNLAWRVLAAILVIAATVAALVAMRRGFNVDPFRPWPRAWIVAFGLAWWLWLAPSFVGLLVILAVLAPLCRHPIRALAARLQSLIPGS